MTQETTYTYLSGRVINPATETIGSEIIIDMRLRSDCTFSISSVAYLDDAIVLLFSCGDLWYLKRLEFDREKLILIDDFKFRGFSLSTVQQLDWKLLAFGTSSVSKNFRKDHKYLF